MYAPVSIKNKPIVSKYPRAFVSNVIQKTFSELRIPGLLLLKRGFIPKKVRYRAEVNQIGEGINI